MPAHTLCAPRTLPPSVPLRVVARVSDPAFPHGTCAKDVHVTLFPPSPDRPACAFLSWGSCTTRSAALLPVPRSMAHVNIHHPPLFVLSHPCHQVLLLFLGGQSWITWCQSETAGALLVLLWRSLCRLALPMHPPNDPPPPRPQVMDPFTRGRGKWGMLGAHRAVCKNLAVFHHR